MKKLILSVVFAIACVFMFATVAVAEEVKAGVVAGHSVLIKEHQDAITTLTARIDCLQKQKTEAKAKGQDTTKAGAKIKALEKLLADKAKEIAKLEAKAAGVEAGKEVILAGYTHEETMLDKYMGSSVEPEQYKYLLPKEASIAGVIRKDCPAGTVQNYKRIGANEQYTCEPLEPKKEPATWGEAFGYCALGGVPLGVAAGAGNYFIGSAAGNHVEGVRDGLAVGIITSVVAIPTCALLVKAFGR